MWLWPFNSFIYKIKGFSIYRKTKKELAITAKEMKRSFVKILKENK
jgi:hypothetical protein